MGQSVTTTIAFGWDAGNDDDIPEWAEGLFYDEDEEEIDTDDIRVCFSGVKVPSSPWPDAENRPSGMGFEEFRAANNDRFDAYYEARNRALDACPFDFEFYGHDGWSGRVLIVKGSNTDFYYEPAALDLTKMTEQAFDLKVKAAEITKRLDVEMPEPAWIVSTYYG